MVKAIIFDYGGVISKEGRFMDVMGDYDKRFGIDKGKFLDFILPYWNKAKVGEIDSMIFWGKIGEYLKIDKDKIRKEWVDGFGINEDVLNLCKELKSKYDLAILSNNIEDWIDEEIERYKLDEIFEIIISSHAVKLKKPDRAIYELVLEMLELPAEECVFIDDKERNTKAADELGFKTIVFDNFKNMKKKLKDFDVDV